MSTETLQEKHDNTSNGVVLNRTLSVGLEHQIDIGMQTIPTVSHLLHAVIACRML